jgi:hypothetical protein
MGRASRPEESDLRPVLRFAVLASLATLLGLILAA